MPATSAAIQVRELLARLTSTPGKILKGAMPADLPVVRPSPLLALGELQSEEQRWFRNSAEAARTSPEVIKPVLTIRMR
jgi:hypothetical protein